MTVHNPIVEQKIRELIDRSRNDPALTVEECAARANDIRQVADRVVPKLTNAEMLKINAAMGLFQLKHNSLDPVDIGGKLFPGVKPSFRGLCPPLARPMTKLDWEFAHLLAVHIARPWRVRGAVHSFDGERWDEYSFEFEYTLKFRYIEELIDTVIADIRNGLNHKFLRHNTWTAQVWNHREDGKQTRNKRKKKRRK